MWNTACNQWSKSQAFNIAKKSIVSICRRVFMLACSGALPGENPVVARGASIENTAAQCIVSMGVAGSFGTCLSKSKQTMCACTLCSGQLGCCEGMRLLGRVFQGPKPWMFLKC